MKSGQKQKEAEQMIDEFAAKLLALNDGNEIPTDWNIRLKLALTPEAKNSGRKRNYDQVTQIVKQLALSSENVRKQRTKHHNPAIVKDEIATANKTSRKTVERIDEALPIYLSEIGKLESLDPQLQEAYKNGIAAAICELRSKDDAIELKARQQESRRHRNRLLSPPEE